VLRDAGPSRREPIPGQKLIEVLDIVIVYAGEHMT
jgi:hypothetical protein